MKKLFLCNVYVFDSFNNVFFYIFKHLSLEPMLPLSFVLTPMHPPSFDIWAVFSDERSVLQFAGNLSHSDHFKVLELEGDHLLLGARSVSLRMRRACSSRVGSVMLKCPDQLSLLAGIFLRWNSFFHWDVKSEVIW